MLRNILAAIVGYISSSKPSMLARPLVGQSLSERLTGLSRLDRGEAEAIALARSRGIRLIADDSEARRVAETVGVEYVGTAGVLLEARVRRRLTLGELEMALRELCEVLWLSPAVVAEIMRLARETDS